MNQLNNSFYPLTSSQILQLEHQGCVCPDWDNVRVSPDTSISLIRNTRFAGKVDLGPIVADSEVPFRGIFNAVLCDCVIGVNPYINNVHGMIRGLVIGDNVVIDNVGRITGDSEATCGLGVPVSVLDETGSRPVPLFPQLTSQLASLMARYPRLAEHHILPILTEQWETAPLGACIGDNVRITDCKRIHNVRIDSGVSIEGASDLCEGQIINSSSSASPLAYIGTDVDARNFMIVDGKVSSGTLLRNCFVGQGVELEKGFTAHDSLFFANCTCENGEACAVLAGPYTVTMHKSSLLIGAEYSFMNAGSGTNASNHMYKLGPVHWGTMQRGVKTSSGAYMMWDGEIGAYSLLMGQHKTHPDTSAFPFSYLFGSDRGETIVAPGLMLRSCGLMRDALKWPKRDRRTAARLPLHDNIHFQVLNPVTVDAILKALSLFPEIEKCDLKNGYLCYRGMLFSPGSLQRGRELYTLALVKYFHDVLSESLTQNISPIDSMEAADSWIDLGGQLMPAGVVEAIRQAETMQEVTTLIDNAYRDYKGMELCWVNARLTSKLNKLLEDADQYISKLQSYIDADRATTLASIRR